MTPTEAPSAGSPKGEIRTQRVEATACGSGRRKSNAAFENMSDLRRVLDIRERVFAENEKIGLLSDLYGADPRLDP